LSALLHRTAAATNDVFGENTENAGYQPLAASKTRGAAAYVKLILGFAYVQLLIFCCVLKTCMCAAAYGVAYGKLINSTKLPAS
jgi:hypothetical protein